MSGNLFIVCAPSGAGKTSLVGELLKADAGIRLSVSYTTRDPRPGEADGREYHFVTPEKFAEMAKAGAFLESAHVHGNYYGTSQHWISEQRAAGADILLPSIGTLVSRLNKRAQDPPEVIARRITAAREEISHVSEFNYVIINDKFDQAVLDLIGIVRAHRLLASSQLSRHSDLINRMI